MTDRRRSAHHPAGLSRREALLFEAGIKLGGVFHQYLGMPVSDATSPGVARTIERAVALQPYVAAVEVRLDPSRGGPIGRGRFAYRYLVPEMLDVRVLLRDGDEEVEARLRHRPELNYPLMSVVRVGQGRAARPRARRRATGGAR
jgi:dihydroneopterin aldolase